MLDWADLGASTIRISVPYAGAALGGTLSERGGVVNIGLEGMMLAGAFGYAAAAYGAASWLQPSNPWVAPCIGLAGALLAAVLLAMVHAILSVILAGDHILAGLAVNMLSFGGTNVLLKAWCGSASNSPMVPRFPTVELFGQSGGRILDALIQPLVVLMLLSYALGGVLLAQTRFGLRLRACGENPHAADSVGLSVRKLRTAGVLLSGLGAGLSGAYLASDQGLFSSNMSNGRGFLALAAMILGRWQPRWVLLACLLFGGAEALQNQLQILRESLRGQGQAILVTWWQRLVTGLPLQAIQAFPFLLTLAVLAGVAGKTKPPLAVGQPFIPEGR